MILVNEISVLPSYDGWIVGTPEDVPESSPFYSKEIQIAYVNNPEKGLLHGGMEHFHKPPIEEYYLVLEGALDVKVENKIIKVERMQILKVPPMKRHKITDYSFPLGYFTIRAPISTTETSISSE